MSFIGGLMILTGVIGGIFLGIGTACWLDPLVRRWRERRRVRRVFRAAMWRWK